MWDCFHPSVALLLIAFFVCVFRLDHRHPASIALAVPLPHLCSFSGSAFPTVLCTSLCGCLLLLSFQLVDDSSILAYSTFFAIDALFQPVDASCFCSSRCLVSRGVPMSFSVALVGTRLICLSSTLSSSSSSSSSASPHLLLHTASFLPCGHCLLLHIL